jgi:hypothetical protein
LQRGKGEGLVEKAGGGNNTQRNKKRPLGKQTDEIF